MSLIDSIVRKDGMGSGSAKTGWEVVSIPNSPIELSKPKPLEELGVSGLLRTKGVGYVYEEWLRDLGTHRQKQIYREMRDNDAVIGAMFFAIEMILRRADWHVEPEKGTGSKGEEYAQFIRDCMEDMSHTWPDFIAECVNMFTFGFALFETIYKRRQGPNGKKTSRFKDGLIGWRKMAPRAQESILYWMWDEEGGLQGAVQLAAPDYHSVAIPIEKLLLVRTTSMKNNPEGRSVLRNCYRSWFFKRRIEEVEGIGIERDLCGLPVLSASAETIVAMGGEQKARQLVRAIRVDDQAGIILPLAYDERGNPMVKLELLRAGGSKQMDTSGAIGRYNQDMLNTILAGFIQFGQTPTGSRSMHLSASQIFAEALAAFMDSIAAVFNRIAIPRLMALNKMDLSKAPKITPGEVGVKDLADLSNFVMKLSQAGLTFFDTETANYLRSAANLPSLPEEEELPPAPPPVPGQPVAPPVPSVMPGHIPQPVVTPKLESTRTAAAQAAAAAVPGKVKDETARLENAV